MDISYIHDSLVSCVLQVGNQLLSIPDARRAEGYWVSSQFKSIVDLESHNLLCSFLSSRFPDIPILSEESDYTCFDSSDYFIIDPIDGTRSYAQGYPGWVVQAAFVSSGFPQCSVIFAPALDTLYTSVLGKGSFFNYRRLELERSKNLTSITDNYPSPTGISKYLYEKLSLTEYVESGSISLKLCLVASGKADLFVKDMRPRDWDIIPPLLLLSELGCFVSDLNFRSFHLNQKSLSHNGLIACRSMAQVSSIMTVLSSYTS